MYLLQLYSVVKRCQYTKILVMSTSKISNINKLVGLNIRSMRVKKEYTQELLAEKADLSKNSVSSIERGQMSPTLETLDKIAKALNTTISAITNIDE